MKPRILRLFSISRNAYVWGCVSPDGSMGRGETAKEAFSRWLTSSERMIGSDCFALISNDAARNSVGPSVVSMQALANRSRAPAYVEVPVEPSPWWKFW